MPTVTLNFGNWMQLIGGFINLLSGRTVQGQTTSSDAIDWPAGGAAFQVDVVAGAYTQIVVEDTSRVFHLRANEPPNSYAGDADWEWLLSDEHLQTAFYFKCAAPYVGVWTQITNSLQQTIADVMYAQTSGLWQNWQPVQVWNDIMSAAGTDILMTVSLCWCQLGAPSAGFEYAILSYPFQMKATLNTSTGQLVERESSNVWWNKKPWPWGPKQVSRDGLTLLGSALKLATETDNRQVWRGRSERMLARTAPAIVIPDPDGTLDTDISRVCRGIQRLGAETVTVADDNGSTSASRGIVLETKKGSTPNGT